MLPLQAVPLILISLSLAQAKAMHMWCAMWEILRLFPLNWRAARRDRLQCWNVPSSLTIPICLGRPRMREGMTEEWRDRERERKGGRMMEWLLNIQQAVKSMQGVVGRLLYGGASVLRHFFFFLFWFHSFWTLSCLLPCFFNLFPSGHSVDIPCSFFVFLPALISFFFISRNFIPSVYLY